MCGRRNLRQLDALVAGDVRLNLVEVERLRERSAGLADCFALVAGLGERGDQGRDMVDGELVDPSAAQVRRDLEDTAGRGSVHVLRLLVDVDAARPPAVESLGERRQLRRLGLDERQVGDAELGELALDRSGAQHREPLRPERAGETRGRVAAAGPVLDAVARAALGRPWANPDTSHGRPLKGVLRFLARSGPPCRFRSSPGRCR
jgi:hypothetical protein